MTDSPMGFVERLQAGKRAGGSSLCIGLDPEPSHLPAGLHGPAGTLAFCRAVVDATADLVCAYKPNLAFFERWGADGWRALESLVAEVPAHIPVIADGKRGDIGNTSLAYAEALFERLGAAACTASPYLGTDAVAPLLDHPRGFTFLLCRTSNAGAGAIQDLQLDGEPLYAHVMRLFHPWIAAGRAGLVIGARAAAAFALSARLAPGALLLVPGVGAQGGTPAELGAALSPDQRDRVIVSVSRAIIHAGTGSDFAAAARKAALAYRDELAAALGAGAPRAPDAAG